MTNCAQITVSHPSSIPFLSIMTGPVVAHDQRTGIREGGWRRAPNRRLTYIGLTGELNPHHNEDHNYNNNDDIHMYGTRCQLPATNT